MGLPDKRELARLYYDLGMTQRDIAAKYQVTDNTLSKHFRRCGLLTRSRHGKRPEPRELARLMAVHTDDHIMEMYGVRYRVLSGWYRLYGLRRGTHA